MSEDERDHKTVHNRHFWDLETWFDEWENSDDAIPLRCSRCGFEARTIGADTPPNCACDISKVASYDDPSDHWPECPYFAGPSCPVWPSTSDGKRGDPFIEWFENLMTKPPDKQRATGP